MWRTYPCLVFFLQNAFEKPEILHDILLSPCFVLFNSSSGSGSLQGQVRILAHVPLLCHIHAIYTLKK